jgi:uncharacterized protein DUF6220
MARKVYSVVGAILLVLLVFQFFLGGLGVFTVFEHAESGQPAKDLFKTAESTFGIHFFNGVAIFVSLLVMLVCSFIARNPWRVTGITALPAVLVFLQPIIAHTGFAALSALHIVNALAIASLGFYLTWSTWTFRRRGVMSTGVSEERSELVSEPAQR